jgi:hypothetical protein
MIAEVEHGRALVIEGIPLAQEWSELQYPDPHVVQLILELEYLHFHWQFTHTVQSQEDYLASELILLYPVFFEEDLD